MTTDDYDYGELLVVQHEPSCGPDALRPTLDGRADQRPWRLVDVGAEEPLPTVGDRVRGVLVLGGSAGVPDQPPPPWREPELAWLGDVVAAGVPVFGICLGAQLLAAALGGSVERRPAPEMAYLPLTRTLGAADDEVFAGWPDGAYALLVHEDEVVALPRGATAMLEGSDGTPAWRTEDGNSYGVQFHPETSLATLEGWLARPGFVGLAAAAGVEVEPFVEEARRRDPFVRAVGVSLVARWLDGVVGRDDPTPRRRR